MTHKHSHHTYRYNCVSITLWVFFFIMIMTFFILAFTLPANNTGYYQKNLSMNNKIRKNSADCKIGEYFDEDIEVCSPITRTPLAVDEELIDRKVDKCDSFFSYTNGEWLKSHDNEDRSFSYVYRKNRKQIHDIIKDPASGPIYKFYRSCLDTLVYKQHEYENMKQKKYIKKSILSDFKTHNDLPIVFARLHKLGYNAPFTMVIEPHPTKNEMIPLFMHDTVPGYNSNLTRHLNAWNTINGGVGETFVDYINSDDYKNDMIHMKDFIEVSPFNFWKEYLIELNGISMLEIDLLKHHGDKSIWVIDKYYFINFLTNLKRFSVKEWKNFIKASIDYNTNDYLPTVPTDSYFRKHEMSPTSITLHKMKKDTSTEYTDEHCMMITHKLLPGVIAKEFLKRDMTHSEKTRSRVTKMVKNLRSAYVNIINDTPWMSETTKNKAIEKIQSIIVRAIHPRTFESEPFTSRLTIDRYIRNINMIRRYRARRNFELWTVTRNGVDRDVIQRFGAPLTTVNAYYSPQTNTITVFAGIVRTPFYSEKFDDVSMYATLGMICAHELSHALDNTGRLFNKEGSLVNWWEEEDVKKFKEKTQCVVNEYKSPNGCEEADYGRKTLGEDIADIHGLKIAFNAYLSTNKNATTFDKQNFFIIFSQMWAESFDQKHLCAQIKSSDPHAIAKYRVDVTLRQMKEFKKVFGCKDNSKMVNEKQCVIFG